MSLAADNFHLIVCSCILPLPQDISRYQLIMFGGRGRRDDEGFGCPDCGDWTTYDEDAMCTCCENVFCAECVASKCDMCLQKENLGPYSYSSICESCIDYPGCEACGDDVTICKLCIKDHLKNCNKQSRAERIISSESHSITENEKKIDALRKLIASKQSELNHLESAVAASKERKAQAEAELKGEHPSKKQKSN